MIASPEPFAIEQRALCAVWSAEFTATPFTSLIGISRTFSPNTFPVNGLRHPQTATTAGWFIWSGNWSTDDNFFAPLHTAHLLDRCPEIIRYLGLAPGWRFLVAPQQEDVWFDEKLLHV
jgi:hypothetical protein